MKKIVEKKSGKPTGKVIRVSDKLYTSIRKLALKRRVPTFEVAERIISVGLNRIEALSRYSTAERKMNLKKAAKAVKKAIKAVKNGEQGAAA